MIRTIAFSLALLCGTALVPLATSAQAYPPPPYARPNLQRFTLRGTVAYFRPYFLVLDTGGRQVRVHLHVGTVILPTGLTLVPGMVVGIDGYWGYGYYRPGGFVANRIVLLR
ncbi:MAG: hypothetical protein ACREMP_10180 [Candidatus Tyrphobacter sp.]